MMTFWCPDCSTNPPPTPTYCVTQTPLHHAALNGRAKCLQILLEHGARDSENARHETALDMVRGKTMCEKILEQAASKIKLPNPTQAEERLVEGKGVE